MFQRSLLFVVLVGVLLLSCVSLGTAEEPVFKPLFDGKTLGDWKAVKEGEFKEGGKVSVTDGCLHIAKGDTCSGAKYTGKFPTNNYEITLEAQRLEGSDFFCGLTFPIDDKQLTLIVGGWGGGVLGLSCIDGYYAADNETVYGMETKSKQWYPVSVAVTGTKIVVKIEGDEIIEFDSKDRKIEVSDEMKPCAPLGIATWQTTGAIRKIQWRELKPAAEKKESDE